VTEARSWKPEARSKGALPLLLASCFLLLASSAPLVAQTYNHISGDGQSNCTGAGGNALSGGQPYNNLGFQYAIQPPTTSSTVALTNTNLSSSGDEYPIVSIANEITYLSSGHSYRVVGDFFDCVAGASYNQLKKGSAQYNNSWFPMFSPTPADVKTVINNLGYTYNFLAMYVIHGEADFASLTAQQYENALFQWLGNQTTDINTSLGTNVQFPRLVHQFAGWNDCNPTGSSSACGTASNYATPTMTNNGSVPSTPIGQWQAAVDQPRQFIVSPGYQFTFAGGALGLHMDAGGLIGMGSLMGKQLSDWIANPNRVLFTTPRFIAAPSGTSWSIQFWVPTGHLVFDTSTLAESPAGCHGFEFGDNSGAIACPSQPTLSGTGSPDGGNDTVNFTLSRACGTGCYIRYAWTGTAGAVPGTSTASHGNLRDTDTRQAWCGGQTGGSGTCSGIAAQDLNLYDWAVTFTVTSFPYSFNPFGAVTNNNIVTVYEDDSNPNGDINIPVLFGRAFKQGEIPSGNCPQPVINGTPAATWQCNIHSAWPDGSVKFAHIAAILPNLLQDGSDVITFQPVITPRYTPPTLSSLSPSSWAGIYGTGWGAQMVIGAQNVNGTPSNNESRTLDLPTMLADSDPNSGTFCRNTFDFYGPVVNAVIVQDCTTSTKWDVGWRFDGTNMNDNSGSAFTGNCGEAVNCAASNHPWGELYFFSTGAVRADLVVENDWSDRAQDQLINVDYYIGSTPTKVLGYDGVPRVMSSVTFTPGPGAGTLTASGANFQPADIGSSVHVTGPGQNDTTICSRQSATQVTLCSNGGGNSPPYAVTVYVNDWLWGQMYRKTFWTGTGFPGNVIIDHNWPYIVSTEMAPPFDTTKSASADSNVLWGPGSRRDEFCSANDDFTCWITVTDMGERGGHGSVIEGYQNDDPSPIQREPLLYLTQMANCGIPAGECAKAWFWLTGQLGQRDTSIDPGYSLVGGAGFFNNAGNIPYHYRESRATAAGGTYGNQFYCASLANNNALSSATSCGTTGTTAFGRVQSRYFDPTSRSGYISLASGAATPNTGHWDLTSLRWLEFTYIGWLLTGDYYYALDTQMNGAWSSGIVSNNSGSGNPGTYGAQDYGSNGFFAFENFLNSALRQAAGLLDATLKARTVSPDGSLEQTVFDSFLASNAEVHEGIEGITGSSLTPSSTNPNCASFNINSANRWDWGRCTVASFCGSGEPQGANCTPVAQAMHNPAPGQTVDMITANDDADIFTVYNVAPGNPTVLYGLSSTAGSSIAAGDVIYFANANASNGYGAINGMQTVSSVGSGSGSNCGSLQYSCTSVTLSVNTTGASGSFGSIYGSWGSFGLITNATPSGSATVLTSTTIDSVSNQIAVYGCVNQSGTNWANMNGIWPLTKATATTYSIPFNSSSFPGFSQSGCYWAEMGKREGLFTDATQGWMEGIFGQVVNEMAGQGVNYFANVAREVTYRAIEKVLDPNYNPFLLSLNIQPLKGPTMTMPFGGDNTANPYFTTWQQVMATLIPQAATLNTFSPSAAYDAGGNSCNDHNYYLVNRALLAYAPPLTDASGAYSSSPLSGQAAWNWVNKCGPFFNNPIDPSCANYGVDTNCGSADIQIKFAYAPLNTCSINPATLGPYTVGEAVNQTLTESNCSASSWSDSGTFPPGLSFNTSSAALSGAITSNSGSPYTSSVSYSTASNNYSIAVDPAPSVTQCGAASSGSCPSTAAGSAYFQSFTISGGVSPVTCAMTSGSLSGSGLTVNNNCTISGTAVAPALYSFSVTPTDANSVSGGAITFALQIAGGGGGCNACVSGQGGFAGQGGIR
jgi:Putative Ig domain